MESLQLALPRDLDCAGSASEASVKTEKSSTGEKWSIVMEEVWFPCFGSYANLQVHNSEEEALMAFGKLKGPRILVDANGVEVTAACGAPWKKYALRMIRQKLARNHYALPCHHARARNVEDLDEPEEFDFSDNEFFPLDDFTNSALAVELPRKAVPSDLVSTVGDLGSSRTTHSEFTIATLESSRRSTEGVPPMPQPDQQSDSRTESCNSNGLLVDQKSAMTNDSVDICQSTSSSVYRLLDLDSRSGSVSEE
jgi:hypothetical protein